MCQDNSNSTDAVGTLAVLLPDESTIIIIKSSLNSSGRKRWKNRLQVSPTTIHSKLALVVNDYS